MNSINATRRVTLLLFLASGMAFAQSTLPATHPTAPPPAIPSAPIPAAPTIPALLRHVAKVTYVQGQLEVSADNSSLNDILRAISRITGMTITGGVTDQRVFGNYGPAPLPEVLTTLLQGTGTNMLLNTASNAPAKLVLTQQQGGPTPPNPNAPGFEDDMNANMPVMSNPADPSRLNIPPPAQRPSRPVYAPPVPPPHPPPPDMATDPVPTAAPADNPSSPNGVQTPQQIYQQLLQMQNAQPRR